jgi:PAS domain S-box-containing protein
VVVHPDDKAKSTERWNQALERGEVFDSEFRLRKRDGEYRWFITRNVPLKDSEGRIISWFGSATDIHDLKEAESARRESEERFRLLVEGTPDYAMFLLDLENRITYWSIGAERVFGWTSEEAIGRGGDLIFTAEDKARGAVEEEWTTALDDGVASDRRWHVRKDGRRIWVDGVMRRLDREDGTLRGMAKVARDATDQHAIEQALRSARDELEQRVLERTSELTDSNRRLKSEMQERTRLEQEILLISEREKRRIGQDLHDSLCQELAATAFFLETQAQKLAKKRSTQAKLFSEAAQNVNANVGLARDLARGLHPIELNTSGLADGLNELAYRTQHSSKVTARFICPRPVRIRDDAVALNLYRIAQEAITNALKHGKPSEIVITLKRKRTGLCLEVTDNGGGFSAKRSGKGMGVDIMHHRANVIGARLTIESRPGRGTSVTCILAGE